ncbi:hypothetical protein HOD19_00550 [bacterium]|jgi:hypothetical protein|nr:hypothetical protein [bacterium]MBT4649456.1 hypothetical protein [bacterium]
MNSAKELEKQIEKIKKRNQQVEADKAWEISWTRRFVLLIFTYIVIVIFFFFAQLPNPFINAIITAVAFVISTLSVPLFKKWWLSKFYRK